MTKKYLCPKHKEETPSAVAYATGYHCFGCGASGPLNELGLEGERIEITYIEDLASSIDRINHLPKQLIRGFSLPADSTGYYLVWNDNSYYKRRIINAESGNKYRGPSGHRKPQFIAREGSSSHLVLVEGEFNALSLASLEIPMTIISPGGAGDFYSKGRNKDLLEYAKYDRVDIVVDDDGAGLQAAIECSSQLKVLGCANVKAYFVKTDFNEVLCEKGKEGLEKAIRDMGLLGGV